MLDSTKIEYSVSGYTRLKSNPQTCGKSNNTPHQHRHVQVHIPANMSRSASLVCSLHPIRKSVHD